MHVCAHIRNIQANHNINIGKKYIYIILQLRIIFKKKKKKRPALKLLMLSSLSEKKKNEKPKFSLIVIYIQFKTVILCIDASLTRHRNKHYAFSFKDKLPSLFN